jgi:hypothetical protein
MPPIVTNLWFDGQAEEAAEFLRLDLPEFPHPVDSPVHRGRSG